LNTTENLALLLKEKGRIDEAIKNSMYELNMVLEPFLDSLVGDIRILLQLQQG